MSMLLVGCMLADQAGGGSGDPFFANVKSLLHMNGTDASTTFTDEIGNTWTAFGDAQIDTADSKFGGASGLFDGSGDYLRSTESSIFDITGDFTIEAWVKPQGASGSVRGIFNRQIPGTVGLALQLRRNTTDKLEAVLRTDGSSTVTTITSTNSLSTSAFQHVALTREGSTVRIFIDGNLEGSGTRSGAMTNATEQLTIGAIRSGTSSFGSSWNGWIDDLRFTIGVARYTGSFTPPTTQFPDS